MVPYRSLNYFDSLQTHKYHTHTHTHTLTHLACMLMKTDKQPSQTTSYQSNSLLSAIMKLFEPVIETRLWKHLEDNSFFSKYQSGFRKSNSANYHLFRLSQTIMESFNRGEHVIAAFLDVEKAFDNVWHNGLRYIIYRFDMPTKLCRWLSDLLVGRVIHVKIEGFFNISKNLSQSRCSTRFKPESITFSYLCQ